MKLATVLLLALSPTPASAMPARWPVYVNVLHRYRVCYPADLLTPQGETDNSAGQSFRSGDGAELEIFGYYLDDDAPLSRELAGSASTSAKQNGKVTYRRERVNWGAAAGSDGKGHLFYIKMLRRQDQIVKLELRYPSALAERYGRVARRVARCFALTR